MNSAVLACRHWMLVVLGATGPGASGALPVAVAPGEYALTIETVLPHLEEALRYATTRELRCLDRPDATGLFPLLRHQAFTGCELVPAAGAADGRHFDLQCTNRQAAAGSAVFAVEPGSVSAVLEVKMGGKNMTLSQRLRGRRSGPCAQPAPQVTPERCCAPSTRGRLD